MTTPKEQEEQPLERSAPGILETTEKRGQTEAEVTTTEMAKILPPYREQSGVLIEILQQRRRLRRRLRLR